MRFSGPIRGSVLVAAALCGAAAGQGLPAASPTAAAQSAQAAKKPGDLPAHRAEVTYRTGVLSIAAENSSLNQILREIGQLTGMKITGGVNDERVYGSYGPADTETVLTALLKGTGSNMMLVLDDRLLPKELVLTPRMGGPTPPNPNAAREREEDDLPPMRMPRVRGVEGVNQSSQFHPPPQQQPPAEIAPPPAATPDPAAGDTTQQSPNGVKTPQEIYDQLMKLQQQQQQKPATPPPPQ